MYAALIWTYCFPEESILFGRRWAYKEEPEVSNKAIRYAKFASITAMIGLPIVVISLILEIHILRLLVVVFPVIFIFGALRIFSDDKGH